MWGAALTAATRKCSFALAEINLGQVITVTEATDQLTMESLVLKMLEIKRFEKD